MVVKLGAPAKKKGVLDDPRWAKPIAAFTKKFPEFAPGTCLVWPLLVVCSQCQLLRLFFLSIDLEKVPGYQEMVLKAHEHLAELEPWYALFVDICDWRVAALELLLETSKSCPVRTTIKIVIFKYLPPTF